MSTETKAKGFFANYGLMAIIAVLLLVFLPPLLSPYMGIFGTYTSYVVTGVVVIFAQWLTNRGKKYIVKE